MAGEKAALLATDPPYCVDYTGMDRPIHDGKPSGKDWSHVYREVDIKDLGRVPRRRLRRPACPTSRDDAAIYVWHAHVQQPVIAAHLRAHGLLLHQVLVWVKPTATFGHSYYRWQHEPCAFGWRAGTSPTHGFGQLDSVWEVRLGRARRASSATSIQPQKPTRLFEIPMEQHTKPGAIVLEPFSGSGIQIIAAEKLGRRCRAIEIQPAFVDVAIRRWEKATGKEATLDGPARPSPRSRPSAASRSRRSPREPSLLARLPRGSRRRLARHPATRRLLLDLGGDERRLDPRRLDPRSPRPGGAPGGLLRALALRDPRLVAGEEDYTMRKIPADAFEFYAALGPARSYQAVAEKYAVSKRSVTKFALKEEWQERLQTIEVKAREASDQKAQETLEAIRTRHLKGMRFIQAKAIEALKSSSLETVRRRGACYTAAVREERVMLGEPSDRTAISVDDTIRREYTRWMVSEADSAVTPLPDEKEDAP